uniref:EF-hand domain-containing protein n=1 Tax=Skeletonema marinoi TaxID=267567 RepID=A0A7S2LKI3_9STRA
MPPANCLIALSALLCATVATAFTAIPTRNNNVVVVAQTQRVRPLFDADKPTEQDAATNEEAEYDFNEADFADYTSDYSDIDEGEEFDGDDEDEDLLDDPASLVELYDDYDSIGGYDLSPFEKHAREVFLTYADRVSSSIDHDSETLHAHANEDNQLENSGIQLGDLYSMLQTLDITATEEESEALFKYLDEDGSGIVELDEFLPWYAEAVDSVQQMGMTFQQLVKSRRTVNKFDATEVDDGVLRRAIECAIAAPNRSGTEPWRFIKLGKETIAKLVDLRGQIEGSGGSFVSWTRVPHWIVVTYPRKKPDSGPDGNMQQREDFKSVCCAVQNFMLSMWSEGIGTKWTDGPIQRTEEFAKACGIDLEKEKVAGVIWYGFARGGLNRGVQAKYRKKGVEEVLDILP